MHMNTNNMSGYLTSNYIKGEDLDADLWIEAIICSVTERAFGEDGESDIKPLIRIEDGRGQSPQSDEAQGAHRRVRAERRQLVE
jgi:hypothetical protein